MMAKAPRLISWMRSLGRARIASEQQADKIPAASPLAARAILDGRDVLTAWFEKHGCCPDCGGTEFLDGPRAGMSQNIKCARAICGAEFNVARFEDRIMAVDRIRWDHPPRDKAH
jgi:hypothetical protein